MTTLTLEEIKEFLRNRPGYLNEGGKRLRNRLREQDFETTIKDCKEALSVVRKEFKNPTKSVLDTSKPVKILHYDIETAYGLARVWRPGYKVRVSYDDFVKHPAIICISYKWDGSDTVESLWWDQFQDDKKMLEEFIKVMNEADLIVAHNGDQFDLPWIKTRALYHQLDMYPKYNTVDTLKIARYQFRFPSNKLDDLADYLGLEKKISTNRQLWVDAVCNNDEEALRKMIEYCDQDVFVLEEVYNKLVQMTLPKAHAGVMNNKTKQTSPYTGTSNIEVVKKMTTKAGTTKWLMRDKDNGKYFEMSDTNYKKFKLSK